MIATIRFSVSLLFLLTLSCDLFAKNPHTWVYQYALITAENDTQRKPIFGVLNNEAKFLETEMTDTIAELLILQVEDPNISNDTLNWYGKILAKSRNARYRRILKEVAYRTDRVDVEEHALDYVTDLKKNKKGAQYEAGSIDVATMRKQYIAYSESSLEKNKTLKIKDLKKRANLYDLFAVFGPPQQVVTGRIEGFFVSKIYLVYRGIGRFEFKYSDSKKKWRLRGAFDDPLAYELDLPHYRDISGELSEEVQALFMAMLLDDGLYAPREAIKKQLLSKAPFPEFLDTTAEMLISSFKEKKSRSDTDTLAWICRLLAEHGGPRYKNILNTVATETRNLKLIEYAGTSIKPVGAANISKEAYQPGSINLTQLKQKYPSPYQ